MFMSKFYREMTAEQQLAEIKADRWDSMFFPSQPAFGVVERAFRRGFVHTLVAIAENAEDVPPEFRAWIKANLEIYNKWRDDFRSGRTNNETVPSPPPIIPYRKEIIHETEYTQPCPDCMGYAHPVERLEGWRVLCTRCSRRKTPHFKRKKQALRAWNKLVKTTITPR
jgi:hypothetical protein